MTAPQIDVKTGLYIGGEWLGRKGATPRPC